MNTIVKHKVVVLKNEDPFDHRPWIEACETYKDKIDYLVIDITKNNWLEEIESFKPAVCLLKPTGKTSLFRDLYIERVEVLLRDKGYEIFPFYDELRIYESKRYFAYWAKASNIPHPKTDVFYYKEDALAFLKETKYPIIGKKNIGASGRGIKILADESLAKDYIKRAFSDGIAIKSGPRLNKGKLLRRAWQKITHPKELKNRLKTYSELSADKQKGYVIFQEYIPHNFEWRAVRIGDSFFAHKKMKVGQMASGTLVKNYENPPIKLFDFVRDITNRFGFRSVAVDIFETSKGDYLINEIQCIFGQSDNHQMLVNNIPGRYVNDDGEWKFEEGDFNRNQSFNIRMEYVIEQLNTKN